MTSGSEQSPTISIYSHAERVGTLIFSEPGLCDFAYEPSWTKQHFPISPHILFESQTDKEVITRFLRNLFPEGEAFDQLLQSKALSQKNLYAILKTIGQDTAGVLTFSDSDYQPDKTQLRPITEQELVAKLDSGTTAELVTWDGKYRLSVAGVQSKLNVYKNAQNQLLLADGEFSSTHILKFASEKFPTIVINELWCMRLAQAVGLAVADVSYRCFGEHDTLIVERFDRKRTANGVKKRHMIDGCQALDLPPEFKYEHNFGPGRDVKHIRDGVNFKKLFSFAKTCRIPAVVIQNLLDWLIFNTIIGNSDAHGKNVSFFVGNKGLSITPFYDLVSVVFAAANNEKIDTSAAMAIGDNFDFNNISAFDLLSLADESAIAFSLVKGRITRMVDRVLTEAETLEFIDCELNPEQVHIQDCLKQMVIQRAKALLEQSKQMDRVSESLF